MSRKSIIVANWKMHKTIAEARQYVRRFRELVAGISEVEVVLVPPFTALAAVGEELQNTKIELAAQNMWYQPEGAYTGEISPLMLQELGCHYVILGHSERRGYFKEGDELINLKLRAALAHGLRPILCVGERLKERQAGQTEAVLEGQIISNLVGLSAEQVSQVVIAYEPIWAIGTGETASPTDANAGVGFIRGLIGELYDEVPAQAVRIQYGGSVTPENITELMQEGNIDGALVGGASLDPTKFAEIVRRARS